jgi:hypothetical protein
MAVEDWIDTLCAIWEITDGQGGQIRSYRVYEKNEFPESISEVPCAITYTQGVGLQIMASGGHSMWQGATEFHLTKNVNKANYPPMMKHFANIRAAMAANMKLGGLVDHLRASTVVTPNVQGPLILQYGTEDPHYGIVVYWEVKEGETDVVMA